MNACREKVGTYAGYYRHVYWKEKPCTPCRKAHSQYSVKVPTAILAMLYLNAPIEVQKQVESRMNKKTLDKIVSYYDGCEA